MRGKCLKVHIRWMLRIDWPEVLAIPSWGWSEEEQVKHLRRRTRIGMVAEEGGCVVGAMIYDLYKTRLEVMNFVVLPQMQRQGIGRQMVEKLIGKLIRERRKIVVYVRETNLPAQQFLKDCGFKAVLVKREYYDDTGEDAYLMRWRRRSHASQG